MLDSHYISQRNLIYKELNALIISEDKTDTAIRGYELIHLICDLYNYKFRELDTQKPAEKEDTHE